MKRRHNQDLGSATRKHTWWGQRWIAALEQGSRDMLARLGKGRIYARDGHVSQLVVQPGAVTASVLDEESETHQVTLRLEAFDANTWSHIVQTMSAQALNMAQLLNGEMPRDIDEIFASAGKALFPVDHHEVDADCTCEDWTSPCRHVAATHYVLGDALDKDPFLLFELRGRSKEQLLSELNALRHGRHMAQPGTQVTAAKTFDAQIACSLASLSVAEFDHGEVALPSLSFHFELDDLARHANLLRSLGKPMAWNMAATPAELFEPALQQARQLAVTLASGSGQIRLRPGTPAKRKAVAGKDKPRSNSANKQADKTSKRTPRSTTKSSSS